MTPRNLRNARRILALLRHELDAVAVCVSDPRRGDACEHAYEAQEFAAKLHATCREGARDMEFEGNKAVAGNAHAAATAERIYFGDYRDDPAHDNCDDEPCALCSAHMREVAIGTHSGTNGREL